MKYPGQLIVYWEN